MRESLIQVQLNLVITDGKGPTNCIFYNNKLVIANIEIKRNWPYILIHFEQISFTLGTTAEFNFIMEKLTEFI